MHSHSSTAPAKPHGSLAPSTAQAAQDSAAPSASAAAKVRIVEIDGIRGYLILMMYLAHFLYLYASPLGYLHHSKYSAVYDGEFFVPLSGFVCAIAFYRDFQSRESAALGRRIRNRIGWIFLYQSIAAATLFAFFRLDLPGAQHHAAFARGGDLLDSLVKTLTLVTPPPFVDILPLYIVLMMAIPVAFRMLAAGRVKTFFGILLAGWLAARFSLDEALFGVLRAHVFDWTGYVRFTGFFNPLSWALLFYAGFYLGFALKTQGADVFASRILPRKLAGFVIAALVILFFAICSGLSQFGLITGLSLTQPERVEISVVGLLNTAAISYVFYYLLHGQDRWAPLRPLARLLSAATRLPFLLLIGRNSLFVYSVHVPIIFLLSYMIVVSGVQDDQLAISAVLVAGGLSLPLLALLKRRFFPSLP